MGIRLLPEGVWSRIAAGEVVERPASAVKEMIENALDAEARRIRVKLWDGGRVRIVVEDDGTGIAFEELPLALTSHATSKIGGIEDLESIHTLGYRGEALASLAAVAKVEIRSRPADSAAGVIRAYEGRVLDHVRVNCSPGTRVQVDELFSNLPARRKFLKSASGELRRVAIVLREYALCRPEVSFALEHDGRLVFSADGGGERRRVIEQLWGAEPEILTARSKAGHVEVECWWQPRQGRNEVTSFVNGRSVTDPVIKGAVNTVARELTGGWALFFSVDPALIDVNIHPAKAEIRFRHPNEVFEAVKEVAAQLGAPAPVYVRNGRTFSTESRQHEALPEVTPGWAFNDNGEGSGATEKSGAAEKTAKKSDASVSAPFHAPRADRFLGQIAIPNVQIPDGFGETRQWVVPPKEPDSMKYLGQLDSGYLVFDTLDGLSIIDPHAAHERVAFERIRAAVKEGKRSQALLTPVSMPPGLQLEAEETRAVGVRRVRFEVHRRGTAPDRRPRECRCLP